MQIEYKRAQMDDAKLLVDIYNKAFYEDYIRYGQCPAYGRSVADMEKSIRKYPKHMVICDGEPAGIISYDEKGDGVYYIGCLCVIPKFQGMGLGRKLLSYMLKICPDVREINLITPVDKEQNIRFYTVKNSFFMGETHMDDNVEVVKLTMKIGYREITDYKRGILSELLRQGYSCDDRYEECFGKSWDEFDDFFFDNPEIARKYGFITTINDVPIGIISWDPRNRPEYVEIGHNCIKPEYKEHGFGRLQLAQAVNRIKQYEELKKITVGTNSNLVAPHNYESVGFKLVDRIKNDGESAFSGDYLRYEIML